MILLADSGSTKTDWRLITHDGGIEQYKSAGINPYLQKEEDIKAGLLDSIMKEITVEVDKLYFYGAGCSSKENKAMLARIFTALFPQAVIHIDHDLTAAARALCGHEEGIACILGTGANSCYYDGKEIAANVPSLGYILGDEGSGAWMGKELLSAFIRDELPLEVKERLTKRFELDRDTILENVYQKPMASKYLAGFSKFIFQNLREPDLYRLVYGGFELFFKKNVEKYDRYQQLPVHFTGSVAFYYSNILRQVANDRGVILRNVVESPIAGLTLYHQNFVTR